MVTGLTGLIDNIATQMDNKYLPVSLLELRPRRKLTYDVCTDLRPFSCKDRLAHLFPFCISRGQCGGFEVGRTPQIQEGLGRNESVNLLSFFAWSLTLSQCTEGGCCPFDGCEIKNGRTTVKNS